MDKGSRQMEMASTGAAVGEKREAGIVTEKSKISPGVKCPYCDEPISPKGDALCMNCRVGWMYWKGSRRQFLWDAIHTARYVPRGALLVVMSVERLES